MAVVAGTLTSYYMELHTKYDVAIIEKIPTGFVVTKISLILNHILPIP